MRRASFVAGAVSGVLTLVYPRAEAAGPDRGSRALEVSQRMVRALNAQRRIEVRGTTLGPAEMKTRYVLRYQARNREMVTQTGGPWGSVKVHNTRVTGVSAVFIGKQAYTSMDGTHWYRSVRPSMPRPLDAISLNVANVPCCVPSSGHASVQLSFMDSERYRGERALRLRFACVANGYSLSGEVLIDARTYLPLYYRQRSATPEMTGTFTVSYGGSFTIVAPRSAR